mmetsp:Transcript_44352/g.53588  ORF Transcript_44352/g.53588 Transcript_44352/m.53588 type:complete len:162 (-) Transcript_44352:83-568(-)|eukprot:CAMPEP_0172506934 /NCGR_PEP_ID=MMETSP1066-20121228/199775_1 /TAXON_ID=671091 /ORGANISM="Coscinodiscus wailesii, Strain CCMP2513" /LENGTH=161 /DNA_ID=CAMNT_0013284239 /DNA_START=83 /DNA_END=568 /DNA_ORIENTATION=+
MLLRHVVIAAVVFGITKADFRPLRVSAIIGSNGKDAEGACLISKYYDNETCDGDDAIEHRYKMASSKEEGCQDYDTRNGRMSNSQYCDDNGFWDETFKGAGCQGDPIYTQDYPNGCNPVEGYGSAYYDTCQMEPCTDSLRDNILINRKNRLDLSDEDSVSS